LHGQKPIAGGEAMLQKCPGRRVGAGLIVAVLTCVFCLTTFAAPVWGQSTNFASILKKMRNRLEQTADYQCRFRTFSTDGTKSREVLLAYYYRNPYQIRMEVLEGPHPGSILIYNRQLRPEQVRVIAGNKFTAFVQRMVYGEFFPLTNKWVLDLRGNGIHESDWLNFINEHEKYLKLGSSRFMGEALLNGRRTYLFKLVSLDPEETMSIKEEDVWVDARTYFPVQFIQYDVRGRLARKTTITELQFNTGLDERLFVEFHPKIP
jgi:outer membrane lipoprotein-sorting protein